MTDQLDQQIQNYQAELAVMDLKSLTQKLSYVILADITLSLEKVLEIIIESLNQLHMLVNKMIYRCLMCNNISFST